MHLHSCTSFWPFKFILFEMCISKSLYQKQLAKQEAKKEAEQA